MNKSLLNKSILLQKFIPYPILLFSILLSVLLFGLMTGCNSQPQKQEQKEKFPEQSLIKANRYMVQTEKELIDNYIKRHHLSMKQTGSGLRYVILKEGHGPKTKKGDIVVIDYSVKLITGDEVYSSKNTGPKTFKVGRGNVESGLEEGILLLKKGDKAKFILPSHLAYGLHGDENRIPPKMPIVYNIEIKDIK